VFQIKNNPAHQALKLNLRYPITVIIKKCRKARNPAKNYWRELQKMRLYLFQRYILRKHLMLSAAFAITNGKCFHPATIFSAYPATIAGAGFVGDSGS
jgi:ribosomal protein L39E